jgi:hypothetical protein
VTSQRMVQILVGALGVVNVATGLALLFAPQWFFENIGNYPPFNRHYEGDLGSFITAIGIGLVWAARDPQRYRALIGVALISNAVHFLNHVYDDVLVSASVAHIMQGVVPVGFQMLLLALVIYLSASGQRAATDTSPLRAK